eukprot:15482827-Alexandrium_andersonii.AAC.1
MADVVKASEYTLQSLESHMLDFDAVDKFMVSSLRFAFFKSVVDPHGGSKPIKSWVRLRSALKEQL